MAAAGPGTNTPIDDWRGFFRAFHQLWGQAQALRGYDKRLWGQMLEFLETRATRDGYSPSEQVRNEQERMRRNDDGQPPTRPRIIKSRRE